MDRVELKPVRIEPSDFDAIEARIIELLRRELYLPILQEIRAPKNLLQNSIEDLLSALVSSRIRYSRGDFSGSFNATLSSELKKLGAKWDRTSSTWNLPMSQLPAEVRNALSTSRARFEEAARRIDTKLSKMNPEEIAGKIKLENLFDKTLWKTEKSVYKTMKGLIVPAQLSDEQRKKISVEYSENMERYIADWTGKKIVQLREKVEQHAFAGKRYEGIISYIQKSFGESKDKAKFLARQETNLLMTKFKEARYTSAGVNEYRWHCVKNPKDKTPRQHTPGNVRYYHGVLDGKTFRWDNPPTTSANGDRNNPGEDYNCRCVAIPIVKF